MDSPIRDSNIKVYGVVGKGVGCKGWTTNESGTGLRMSTNSPIGNLNDVSVHLNESPLAPKLSEYGNIIIK